MVLSHRGSRSCCRQFNCVAPTRMKEICLDPQKRIRDHKRLPRQKSKPSFNTICSFTCRSQANETYFDLLKVWIDSHKCQNLPFRIILLPPQEWKLDLDKVKSGAKKTGHFQKLAINKKSTIFVLSSWNLVKIITSWGNHFHQVSWG